MDVNGVLLTGIEALQVSSDFNRIAILDERDTAMGLVVGRRMEDSDSLFDGRPGLRVSVRVVCRVSGLNALGVEKADAGNGHHGPENVPDLHVVWLVTGFYVNG
jgi:hypothetical protein